MDNGVMMMAGTDVRRSLNMIVIILLYLTASMIVSREAVDLCFKPVSQYITRSLLAHPLQNLKIVSKNLNINLME